MYCASFCDVDHLKRRRTGIVHLTSGSLTLRPFRSLGAAGDLHLTRLHLASSFNSTKVRPARTCGSASSQRQQQPLLQGTLTSLRRTRRSSLALSPPSPRRFKSYCQFAYPPPRTGLRSRHGWTVKAERTCKTSCSYNLYIFENYRETQSSPVSLWLQAASLALKLRRGLDGRLRKQCISKPPPGAGSRSSSASLNRAALLRSELWKMSACDR